MNIVFIHTESQDGRLLGFLGNPAFRHATPHMDALAAEGTCFENTYCNTPLCCPSRSSMWSGRFPHQIGAWNNYQGLEPDAPTFADRLEENGYAVRIIGRTDHRSGKHSGASRVCAWTRAAAIPRPVHGETKLPLVTPDGDPPLHQRDQGYVDQACEFLREQQGKSGQKPFFLHLGFHLAHHAFKTSRHFLEKIPAETVELPLEDSLDHPLLPLQRLQKNWNHALDSDGMRLRRRIYFAMIAQLDAMIGEVLEALDRNGLRDNTWVILSSDHGEMAGEHRQYIKLTPFEASMRVPLLIRGPGGRQGQRITAPASLVDLYPTFLDLAGVTPPEELDGHSLVPEVTGGTVTRPPRVFAEHHSTTCPTGTFLLRRGPWKYIVYPGYPSLLFHLEEDPDELRDLSAEKPEMLRTLDAELREIADYEAIDARAKDQDREHFAEWREKALREGSYEEQMGAFYSGAGHPPGPVQPWRDEDEERIRQWLEGAPVTLPELHGEVG